MSRLAIVLLLGACLGLGCTRYRKVQVPPAQDLSRYPTVGLIQFSSSKPRGNYPAQATRLFLQNVFQAQPGVRVLELGDLSSALASVGKTQLDGPAIQALAAKSGVNAIFLGTIELSDAKPSVNLGGLTSGSASVSADVTATLEASLYDASGALLWTQVAQSRDSAGGVGINSKSIGIGADGTEVAYNRMINHVTNQLAEPFRAHWRKEAIED